MEIGSTSSFGAELWTLRDGLKLALDLGCRLIEVKVDVSLIVNAITDSTVSNLFFKPLIIEYRYFWDAFNKV